MQRIESRLTKVERELQAQCPEHHLRYVVAGDATSRPGVACGWCGRTAEVVEVVTDAITRFDR